MVARGVKEYFLGFYAFRMGRSGTSVESVMADNSVIYCFQE